MPRFKIASADVTYQLLDGEVVAIHFTKGIYYNLRGAAAQAFDALAQGVPLEELPSLFSGVPGDAAAKLAELQRRFVEEELLALDSEAGGSKPALRAIGWVEPVFESYTDMQQLLLADPIHDVGTAAWPRVAAAPTGAPPAP